MLFNYLNLPEPLSISKKEDTYTLLRQDGLDRSGEPFFYTVYENKDLAQMLAFIDGWLVGRDTERLTPDESASWKHACLSS